MPSSFRMWIPGCHAARVWIAVVKSGAATSWSSVSEAGVTLTLKRNSGIIMVSWVCNDCANKIQSQKYGLGGAA
jgi:hypothetical protein